MRGVPPLRGSTIFLHFTAGLCPRLIGENGAEFRRCAALVNLPRSPGAQQRHFCDPNENPHSRPKEALEWETRQTWASREHGTVTTSARMTEPAQLLRRVGLFDATMIVMGGIVGAGIFINPYVVARQVHTPVLILGVWVAGGVVAMLGAFIYAELAARMPNVGGQYAYLRDAFHPLAGFLYGWVLLLVIQTGGMAAVTITFARYFLELTGWPVSEKLVAVATITALTVVNCLGVKAGSRVQSVLMLLKIGAIAALVLAGLFLVRAPYRGDASGAGPAGFG